MYKCKVVVLYMNSELDCRWNYGWIEWDGKDTDDLEGQLIAYGKSEEKSLKEIVDDTIVVTHNIVVEVVDTTDGEYYCNSCEMYFNTPDGENCPFCGGEDFVDGDK